MQVPLGEFFRPRKKEVEQLDSKDFLGKPKVTGMWSLTLPASRLKSHFLLSPVSITVGCSADRWPKSSIVRTCSHPRHLGHRSQNLLELPPLLLKLHFGAKKNFTVLVTLNSEKAEQVLREPWGCPFADNGLFKRSTFLQLRSHRDGQALGRQMLCHILERNSDPSVTSAVSGSATGQRALTWITGRETN